MIKLSNPVTLSNITYICEGIMRKMTAVDLSILTHIEYIAFVFGVSMVILTVHSWFTDGQH